MKDNPHRVSFHSSINPDTHEFLFNIVRQKMQVYVQDTTPASPAETQQYQTMFATACTDVCSHLVSLGIPRAQLEKNLADMRLVIGGLTTHYNPNLHTLVLRPDEIQSILHADTDNGRARVVRHEIAHALSRTMLYHTYDRGGITRSGLSTGGMTRAGVVEYGFALNEIVIDTIAVRSGLEKNDSPRARLFHEIASCIAQYAEPRITENELYQLFVRVACNGWGARPEGKMLKHIVRSAYGDAGMSVLMRLRFRDSETEAELMAQIQNEPLYVFLTHPPTDATERAAAARALLKKHHE